MFYEDKAQEVDKLSAKIEDLGVQLNKEQEDCKRFTSKIRRCAAKFAKVWPHVLMLTCQMHRSQVRVQRLGDQLGTDNSKPGNNEEDSSVNAISDGGPNGDGCFSPRHDIYNNASPIKKKLRLQGAASEEIKPGNPRKRERFIGTSTRQDKFSQIETLISLSENKSKEMEVANMSLSKNDTQGHVDGERKQKHEKNSSPMAKVKSSDSGHLMPSTCMAAHAVDEFIESMDIEKSGTGDATVAFENGTLENRSLLFPTPLPPKVARDTYRQYEGDDEDVDVDGDVDIGGPNGSAEVEV
ncbi:hypothetical protein Taro_016976 [Colocasia esculenta]|uniref:Uncharacterized protein n=1 Tax=Colocasia esculenta TaxID=4460 RepID=A0A843UUK7_COLES|nr:hypothetical protein [Colocasia esculenta]